MSKKVSPIPRGYRTATTCLTVFDVDASVAFYQAAFGADLLSRQTGADESIATHATVKIGNSIIALNPEAPEQGIFAPLSLGASVGQVHLYVDDVDASWDRAVEAGAIVRTAPFDAYWGDRTGLLADGNGHLWSIASKIENVSQEEINKRARALAEADLAEAPPVADLSIEDEFPLEQAVTEELVAEPHVSA